MAPSRFHPLAPLPRHSRHHHATALLPARPFRYATSLLSATALLLSLTLSSGAVAASSTTTSLASQPIFAGANVPGNLALVLSVEYPTAISVANNGDYVDSKTYLGYFDPTKCYTYTFNSTTPAQSYFQPASMATSGTYQHQCSGQWSGNFMNWATMQTIDPFRWALSGGYRSVDSSSQTILEKAWGPNWPTATRGCGNINTGNGCDGVTNVNFGFRGTAQTTGNNLPSALVRYVTPFTSWTDFNLSVLWRGNMMVFSSTGTAYQNYQYQPTAPYTTYYPLTASDAGYPSGELPTGGFVDLSSTTVNTTSAYRVYVRVRVCDPTTTLGVAGLEANCVKYGSVYKPEGLLQKYSNQIRYGVLAYLDGNGATRQGGVLREPMGFIGPTYPQPLSTTVITNTKPEWSASTGQMIYNPDPNTASGSNVGQSGVMNYLNKFGEASQTYMSTDNVSELYYAAIRYFENLGNVPEWTNAPSTTELDGFPAVATWADPIAYSCQKNFILGIGDDHTHDDFNTGGGTASDPSANRPKPSAVSLDSFNQSNTWTKEFEALEGISPITPWWIYYGATYNPPTYADSTYYMAGLAYGAHVNDIRPDLTGTQTISTYWMDVEEYGYPEYLNPYYMATKYGGFSVPTTGPAYTLANTTPLPQSEWDTSGNVMQMHNTSNGYTASPQPDNYFLAGNSNAMVSGLQAAFSNIASALQAYPTAFSFSAANVVAGGTESFASQYNTTGWSGTVTASTLTFDSSGVATLTPLWTTNTTLQTQLAGNGWQSARRVATWNGSSGVPFEIANLTATQLAALLPSYSSGPNASTAESNYLAYLRGDTTNEVGSLKTGSTKSLRARNYLLADIVDAALTPVTTPSQIYSDANNPGYAAFKTLYANRTTMVYAGANDGMLHAFAGPSGLEQFAYVPSPVFQGPTGPSVDGIAQFGNPTFTHHDYVDATPLAFDIDLNRTGGTTGSPNWATLLIGGLGKGGKGYYALDVTDPFTQMTTEAQVASKVKWEVNSGTSGFSTMGYSYGAPVVVKTAKWGWVVALTSGYNNSDGLGHLYLVNPKTGALLQDIATPSASSGLTQAAGYVADYSDDTADSIYVGDLNGQIWRFNLTGTPSSYPAPTLLATLTDGSGNQQPVTTAPLIEISPTTRQRYVMVGTGKLLATTDIISANMQTFYVILDGTAGGFNAVSTPVTRATLTAVTDVTQATTLSPTTQGWYLDLGVTSGVAWRVTVNPIAYNGIVSFASLLTQGSDPCQPTGQSEVYALNFATATSVIQSTSTSSSTPAPYYAIPSSVTSEKFFENNGKAALVVGCASGCVTPIPADLTGPISTRLLNWREIPTAQ